jgi:wyosine [tRNA(Phe)-imidazoG37] synthetase (radical SAM superfamily)
LKKKDAFGHLFFVLIFYNFVQKLQMSVFLFDEIIFGPVKSRRLGVSLGINLLPLDYKYCNFDCIYCECGRTYKNQFKGNKFHSRQEVKEKLEQMLIVMKSNDNATDVITFAGNGEPTTHPDFDLIIDDTVALRNTYFPKAKIAVLSNATMIQNKKVFNALHKIENNILKLDSALDATVKLINNPPKNFKVKKLTENLMTFNGNLIIQTMFVTGTYNEINIDNTSDEEIKAWLELLKEIKPREVMVYTIDRDTPSPGLRKVTPEKLYEIAEKVKACGLNVQVSI